MIKSIEFQEVEFQEVFEEKVQSGKYSAEVECVFKLIRNTISKMKIALIMPFIFENPRVLGRCLIGTKYEEILKDVKSYRRKCETTKSDYAHYWDSQLQKLIDYFLRNHEMLEYLPSWVMDLSETEQILIQCMQDLFVVAKHRFVRLAINELNNERNVHQKYKSNKQLIGGIRNFSARHRNRNIVFKWKKAARASILLKLKTDLAFVKFKYQIQIKQEMAKSHNTIKQINLQYASKQKDFDEDVNKAHDNYEIKLKSDIINEKSALAERNKLQFQLQALVIKYDETLLEKTREEIELKKEYDELKKKLDVLLIEFAREEAIYNELYVKKDEEYRRQHEARIEVFVRNRAAKKIQRWFRVILKRIYKLRQLEEKRALAKKKAADEAEKNAPKKGKKK